MGNLPEDHEELVPPCYPVPVLQTTLIYDGNLSKERARYSSKRESLFTPRALLCYWTSKMNLSTNPGVEALAHPDFPVQEAQHSNCK